MKGELDFSKPVKVHNILLKMTQYSATLVPHILHTQKRASEFLSFLSFPNQIKSSVKAKQHSFVGGAAQCPILKCI